MEEKEAKIQELEREIISLKNALTERTKTEKKKAVVNLKKMASELNESAGELIDAVKPVAKKTVNQISTKVKKHPYASVGAALSAGIIIAALAKRNKKK